MSYKTAQKMRILKLLNTFCIVSCCVSILFLTGCVSEDEIIIQNISSDRVYSNLIQYFEYNPELPIEPPLYLELYHSSKVDQKLELYIYESVIPKNGSLPQREVVGSVSCKVKEEGKNSIVSIQFIKSGKSNLIFSNKLYTRIKNEVRLIASNFKQYQVKKEISRSEGVSSLLFKPVYPYSVPTPEQLKKINYLVEKKPQNVSINESLLLAQNYLGIKFKDSNDKILFQFEPLSTAVIGSGALLGAQLINNTKNSNLENYTLIFLAPIAIPYYFFHINGPYKYQTYPFQKDTGFLSRSTEKTWTSAIGLSLNPKSSFYGLDNTYYNNQFELYSSAEVNKDIFRFFLTPSYQFARNDFFTFSFGIGVASLGKMVGTHLRYGANLFYKKWHGFYTLNIVTDFKAEKEQVHELGLGFHQKALEYQLAYSIFRKTVSTMKNGTSARIRYWF